MRNDIPSREVRFPPGRVLIIPSDMRTLAGSRGDDAMINTILATVRRSNPEARVSIVTEAEAADTEARRRGFEPLRIWGDPDYLRRFLRAIDELRPDAVFLMGADILDGYYGPRGAAQMMMSADIAARAGLSVSVLGFSFNASPEAGLKPVFDALHPGVRLNLRDSVSLARFTAFTTAHATPVADSAFLLPTAAADPAVASWIEERKAAGRTVLGMNIHPHLFKSISAVQLDRLVANFAEGMARVTGERAVSWVLLSHDARGADADDICLVPLDKALDRLGVTQKLRPQGDYSAAQLKAIAAMNDGNVCGRMHLAIGSLGSGVPVLAVTYQGKFEGLFQHFDLTDRLLLAPAADAQAIGETLLRFIDEIPALTAAIAERLPTVLAASRRNFSGYFQDDEAPVA